MKYDVAIIGAGISGVTSALILADSGLSVCLLDSHTVPGGCAGYFSRKDHRFDVGATTFVSFQPDGIADRVFSKIGLKELPLERIPEYRLCLPDRTVCIPSDWGSWSKAWAESFPEIGPHAHDFFEDIAVVARRAWRIAERFPSLPLTTFRDLRWSAKAMRLQDLDMIYWMLRPLEGWLSSKRLKDLRPLKAALNMLLQDTTQTNTSSAPALFSFLGLTLMPYGLFRAKGSSKSLWDRLILELGNRRGVFKAKHRLVKVETLVGGYRLKFDRNRDSITCRSLVSSIPVWNMFDIAPQLYGARLKRYLNRKNCLDSAFALFTGIEDNLATTGCDHFQVLSSYDEPLGDGNNFLVSLSASGDTGCAPKGRRAVTISTHTNPHTWSELNSRQRDELGRKIIDRFTSASDKVIPGFAQAIDPELFLPAGPHTYQRFTGRYLGMAGNQGLSLRNTGLNAMPQSFGTKGFYQTGDTTFPGVGTVSCVLSSANVARKILADMRLPDFL